jgi:hypothetical protein
LSENVELYNMTFLTKLEVVSILYIFRLDSILAF